jgi:4-hydroxybenzoyl-CoA thioesterase
MLINLKKIFIEWGDCDPGGIVYFPRYLEYCDACTNALFKRAGLPKPQMIRVYGIAGIPLVETRARFFVPSQYGDMINVESRILDWGRSSFVVRHKMFKGHVLAVEVIEKRVWVARTQDDFVRFKGQPIPKEVKEKFSISTRARED